MPENLGHDKHDIVNELFWDQFYIIRIQIGGYFRWIDFTGSFYVTKN